MVRLRLSEEWLDEQESIWARYEDKWSPAAAERATEEVELICGYRRAAALEDAVRAFVAKWDVVQPQVDSLLALSAIRHAPYTGPSLKDEVDALKAFLVEGDE